ncbi:hypothetical protein E2P64_03940 [Candidatus Bathyarchaeota archaeon]|jgi:hypothetical protein|nr:hypothetical protein E2P64_03940 [Candidatus Bathyarchaeota archaeon]
MMIDVVCSLESFRRFMILSTCNSFIPDEFLEDDNVFPERPMESGTMYVEAEDKETLRKIRQIEFIRVSNVLGVIYNSKSGLTKLKWRQTKNFLGKLGGKSSGNSLVNLFEAGILDENYIRKMRKKGENST